MKTTILSLFVLCLGILNVQAQINEKQLKSFIPKGYSYTESSGEGVKNSSGDILMKAKANDQLSYVLILLRKNNGKLTKIAENENLIIDSDGTGTVLNGSLLTVKSFVGTSSYTNDTKITFVKSADGQYYFDKYENVERDYGVENLFNRISETSLQTGKINFKDANIDELANKIKAKQNAEKEIPKAIEKLAPKGWAIVVWTQGDLNLDSYKNDVLLLLKKENEENKTTLKIYLQQNNGSYKEAASNTQLFSFTEDLAGTDPNFGYNGGLNFNNIRLVTNKGFFTIERRIPDYTDNDYKEGRNDIPFYRNFFHQYYTFKYDGTAKNWFSHRYGVEYYTGLNAKPQTTTQFTHLQIGTIAFNQTNCFPNYVFYEPQPATLYGTLTEKMFFEEPNYGKTPQKDKKVKLLILKTEIPVTIYPVGFQDVETGDAIKENLTEFQVYTNEKVDLKKYLDKKVVLQGVLQAAQSGHHHTPVLMEVKKSFVTNQLLKLNIMNKIKMPLCAFVAIILFAACQNGASKSGNNETTMTKDSATITSVEDKSESKSEFPQNVAMLLPTQYRKESTGYPKGAKEKEWYEFYKDEKSGKWIVAKADLKITYGRDECVGEDVMIIKSKHENAVFFFTPFEGLSKDITTVVEDKPLYPGYEVNFTMNGINFHYNGAGKVLDERTKKQLTPEEIKKKNTEDLEYSTLIDYSVWFNIPKSAFYKIAQIDTIYGATPTLIWAGDLNGDGLPDAILSLPDFYESQHILFFLSDKNDKEKPLKKVVDLMVVNDC